MPAIDIRDATFERLQRHAKPFVDSPDAVINRAIDALEGAPAAAPEATERRIDPRAVPNLTHTKIIEASIGGDAIARPNWNRLLDEVLRRGMPQAGGFEKLKTLCPINMVQGRKEDEGYRYLPDIKISVQGQDANSGCRALLAAAQALGLSVDIGFMWRLKDGAAHPGERARVTLAARRSAKAA